MSYINLSDCKLYYEQSGVGETVLFLHGLGASTSMWNEHAEILSLNYRVILVDIRAHGRSTAGSKPLNIEQFSNDIFDFFKALELSSVHLVGFSLGGMIAYEFAVKYSDLLCTLTISNSTPHFSLTSLIDKVEFNIRLLLLKIFGINLVAFLMAKNLFPRSSQNEFRKRLIEQSRGVSLKYYIETIEHLVSWSVVDKISLIDVPVSIIESEFDYSIFSKQEKYVGEFKNVKYQKLNGSRHMSPWDSKDDFLKIVNQFILKNSCVKFD